MEGGGGGLEWGSNGAPLPPQTLFPPPQTLLPQPDKTPASCDVHWVLMTLSKMWVEGVKSMALSGAGPCRGWAVGAEGRGCGSQKGGGTKDAGGAEAHALTRRRPPPHRVRGCGAAGRLAPGVPRLPHPAPLRLLEQQPTLLAVPDVPFRGLAGGTTTAFIPERWGARIY